MLEEIESECPEKEKFPQEGKNKSALQKWRVGNL